MIPVGILGATGVREASHADFPVLLSVSFADSSTEEQPTLTVDMPPVVNAGDLLVFCLVKDGTNSPLLPDGLTLLLEAPAIGSVRTNLYSKVADGTEGGAQVVFSYSGSNETGVCHLYRFKSGTWGGTPEAAGVAFSSNAPAPPSLTPSWGHGKTFWVAGFGQDAGGVVSVFPLPDGNYRTGEGASTGNDAAIATCHAEIETDMLAPGPFQTAVSRAGQAFTLAIKPAK